MATVAQTLEWIERAPFRVDESVEIDAPPDHVWGFIADHEGWPSWFEVLDGVAIDGEGHGIGGGRIVHAGPLKVVERFLAWDPAERFAFTGAEIRPFVFRSLVEDVRLTALDDGSRTRVTYVQAIEFTPPFGLLGGLVKAQFAKGLAKGLAGLKRAAEAPAD